MRAFFYTCLFALFFQVVLNAQTAEIRGKVKDSEGKPAAFVNIYLNEAQKGSSSDVDGVFVLSDLKPGTYTLVASYIGYKTLTQQVTVHADKVLNLSLELFENAETLREIVIKGYATQNERISSIGKFACR